MLGLLDGVSFIINIVVWSDLDVYDLILGCVLVLYLYRPSQMEPPVPASNYCSVYSLWCALHTSPTHMSSWILRNLPCQTFASSQGQFYQYSPIVFFSSALLWHNSCLGVSDMFIPFSSMSKLGTIFRHFKFLLLIHATHWKYQVNIHI